jgi:hypothetical protein
MIDNLFIRFKENKHVCIFVWKRAFKIRLVAGPVEKIHEIQFNASVRTKFQSYFFRLIEFVFLAPILVLFIPFLQNPFDININTSFMSL